MTMHIRYVPLETVTQPECVARPSAERVSCTCTRLYCGGAVVTDAPQWMPADLCYASVRRLYCDHCDHILMWMQVCSPDGTLQPAVISGGGVIRCRRTIERFLRKYPQAAGVI